MSLLPRLDLELYYRTLADEWFLTNGIAIGTARPLTAGSQNTVDGFIKAAVLSFGYQGKRAGAAVFIGYPFGDSLSERAVGPHLELIVPAYIVEHWPTNHGTTGTGQLVEDIIARYLQINHAYVWDPPYRPGLKAGSNTLQDLPKYLLDAGLIGNTVLLRSEVKLPVVNRPADVVISPASGTVPQTVTLTCATAGATIRYTTDGSAPFSSNSAAQTYSAPISIATACTLRAAAEKTGLAPSNVTEATYS